MKNKPHTIETMNECNKFLTERRENGWRVWQMQYQWNNPEGFHAWFMKHGEPDIEVVTHNEQVQEAIVNFNANHNRRLSRRFALAL